MIATLHTSASRVQTMWRVPAARFALAQRADRPIGHAKLLGIVYDRRAGEPLDADIIAAESGAGAAPVLGTTLAVESAIGVIDASRTQVSDGVHALAGGKVAELA